MSDEAQTLEFDTRGWVTRLGADDPRFVDTWILWSDLQPNVRGYATAVAGSAGIDRFAKFTGATLAQIIDDCANDVRMGAANTPEQGAALWHSRKDNWAPVFIGQELATSPASKT